MYAQKLLMVPAAVAALAFGLAACGGDDSPETPIVIATDTTESLSKAEFITELDAVCSQVDAQIAEFAAQGEGVSAATEIAELRQSVIDEVRDLGPPEEDRATLDEFTSAYRQMIEAGREIGLAVDRGTDTSEPEATLESARSTAEAAAASYGFEECGQPIDSSAAPGVSGPDTDPAAPAPVTPVPAPPPTDGGGGTGTGDGDGGADGGDTGGDTGGGDTGGGGGVGVG